MLPTFTAEDFPIVGGTFIRALGGEGSCARPYRITDVFGLQGLGSSGMLDKSAQLANDIDAASTATWNGGAGFAPTVGRGLPSPENARRRRAFSLSGKRRHDAAATP